MGRTSPFARSSASRRIESTRQERLAVPVTLHEAVRALKAGARHHVECTREGVLVDGRGPIDPEDHVDVKALAAKDRDRRLAEVRLNVRLGHQRWGFVHPSDDVERVDVDGRGALAQEVGRDHREDPVVKIGSPPALENRQAQVVEKVQGGASGWVCDTSARRPGNMVPAAHLCSRESAILHARYTCPPARMAVG